MPSHIKVCILGGKGMLGGDLVEFFSHPERGEGSRGYTVISVDRENYESHRGKSFDVFVNANGNSRRFWANQNPLEDFEASTVSVYRTFFDFKFDKYIYISSSDVYPEHDDPNLADEKADIAHELLEPYGFHKYLSEQIVKNRSKNFLILRCSMMLGRNLKKGPIYDILQGKPLFITRDSRIQMITTREVAGAIDELLRRGAKNEIYNIGGQGAVDFAKIQEYFSGLLERSSLAGGKEIQVAEGAERQVYEMNVSKLASFYELKTSEEYLREFLARRG